MPAFYKIAGTIHRLILRILRCGNSFSFKILMRAGALNFKIGNEFLSPCVRGSRGGNLGS